MNTLPNVIFINFLYKIEASNSLCRMFAYNTRLLEEPLAASTHNDASPYSLTVTTPLYNVFNYSILTFNFQLFNARSWSRYAYVYTTDVIYVAICSVPYVYFIPYTYDLYIPVRSYVPYMYGWYNFIPHVYKPYVCHYY